VSESNNRTADRKRRNFWCWLRLHKWDRPGGHCEDCGVYDDFFDVGEEER
jgi:hypothetical protein